MLPIHAIEGRLAPRPRQIARFSLLAVLALGLVQALPLWGLASVKLAWEPSPEPEVMAYWISFGTSSGDYTDMQMAWNSSTLTLEGLDHSTTYYCAIHAYASNGLRSDYSSEISFTTEPGVPDIMVTGSGGGPMADGSSSVSFGRVGIGSADATRTLILSNEGTADLTGIQVSLGGLLPSEFSVSAPGSTNLSPGANTSVTITCKPGNEGVRSAMLLISSNDPDESPFEIPLLATGVTPEQLMGLWALSSGLTGGDVAAHGTPAHDGVPNLLKFAFNMDPTKADLRVLKKSTGTSGLPACTLDSSAGPSYFTIEYLCRRGSGLIYTAKTSTNLKGFTPMSGTTEVTRVNDEWERVVVKTPVDPESTPRMFGRVDVELPGDVVIPEASLFSQWADSWGLSGDGADLMASSYSDGVPNLIKYAFNMNAAGPDLRVLVSNTGTSGLPMFALDRSGAEAFFTVEFVRRKNSGVVYTPKITADLKIYSPMTGTTTITSIDNIWERVRVRKPIDVATSPALFGIVEVTMP